MYLSRLYIENFRSIQHLDVSFSPGKNVIVGKNNAGKSNIISAIDLVLGEYSPTYYKSNNISETDFFQKQTSKAIFIACTLTKSLGEVLPFPGFKGKSFFLQDKTSHKDIEFKISDNLENLDNLFKFSGVSGEKEIEDNCKKSWLGYKLGDYDREFKNINEFTIVFRAIQDEEGLIIKDMVCTHKKPGNTDAKLLLGAGIRELLIQSAIIPSFRDPSNQLKISNWSWYGKMLKSKIRITDELDSAFDVVNKASETIFKDLTSDIFDTKLRTAFPGTTARFSLAPLNQDIHKQALIYVDDGFESVLQSKGSGIQSAVIIALFDFYIQNVVNRSGSALLAIEEPELFLHPHGRRVIANRLNQFIGNGVQKNQVILTTHSSEFVTVANEDVNIISVRKTEHGTEARNFDFHVDSSSPKQEQINARKIKQILLRSQYTELFFADFVVFTEDAKLFIEEIARDIGRTYPDLGENWMNDYNISVINSGGKQDFYKFAKICRELEIPYIIFADFDFLRDGVDKFYTMMSINPSSLNAYKSQLSFKSPKTNKDYKILSDLDDAGIVKYEQDIKPELRNHHIYLLDGMLENLYSMGYKPSCDKEQGVLEVLEQLIELQLSDGEFSINKLIETTKIKSILMVIIMTMNINLEKAIDGDDESKDANHGVEGDDDSFTDTF